MRNVKSRAAKEVPLTVKVADPVPARLCGWSTERSGMLNEAISVTVPARCPIDTARRSVEWRPAGHRANTIESDTQRVASTAVPPTRAIGEYPLSANAAPDTDRLTDPVVGVLLFDSNGPLIVAASYDSASDTVAARPPTVTAMDVVPRVPTGCAHTTAVSDSHSVASHADPPARSCRVGLRFQGLGLRV
jgi:hypothetical protein